MAYLPEKTRELYQTATSSLANGASLDSGWLDLEQYASYKISVFAGAAGLDLVIDSSENSGGSGVNDIQSTTSLQASFLSTLPCRERYFRFRVTNNTGGAVSNVKFQVTGLFVGTGASVFPDYVSPAIFSPAVLTQSILRGKDSDGVYQNVQVNSGGALVTAQYLVEVERGNIANVSEYNKFGRNPDIDTASTPEDVWASSGTYTGFNATSGEAIEVLSSSASDTGTVVSSGTATGGSTTTLVDTGATFITDGVAVGDCIINDTQYIHGIVSAVTSETTLTVLRFADSGSSEDAFSFASGDSYRVATAGSTGAAVIKLSKMIESDYTGYLSEYVVLNGTTAVDTVGTDYIRCSRAQVILSGSNNGPVGNIRGRQTTTTANEFIYLNAGSNQTLLAVDTTPADKWIYISSLRCAMSRSGGLTGSANVVFNVRRYGEVFRSVINEEITDSVSYQSATDKVISIPPLTDIKWTVAGVSDNNTVVTAEFNGIIVTV